MECAWQHTDIYRLKVTWCLKTYLSKGAYVIYCCWTLIVSGKLRVSGWAWMMTAVFRVRPHRVCLYLYVEEEGVVTWYGNGSNRSLPNTVAHSMGGRPWRTHIFTAGLWIPWRPQMLRSTIRSCQLHVSPKDIFCSRHENCLWMCNKVTAGCWIIIRSVEWFDLLITHKSETSSKC